MHSVRVHYVSQSELSEAGDEGVGLPEGWEPIGGEYDNGALYLVLSRETRSKRRQLRKIPPGTKVIETK